MGGQKPLMVKGKVEAALARLERLGLGGDAADAQEQMWWADLFMLVVLAPLGPITN